MRFTTLAATLVSGLVMSVSAANITVMVGDQGKLVYNPSNVTASVGDTIFFQFTNKNHTVTQSTFANPCEPMTTPAPGIDSGFQPIAPNATMFAEWSFTLDNDTTPLWFFCRQAGHCQKGMVFSVNANANHTFDKYLANALASNATTAPVAASASASASASAISSSSSAASASGSPGTAAADNAPKSSAIRASGNAAVLLAVVGLVSGLIL